MTVQRSITAPAYADDGVVLTQKLVGTTKYGDVRNPNIYGSVSGPTLAQRLVGSIYRLSESGQRPDGLFDVDFGGIQMVWFLQSTGARSCASFFTTNVIDTLSATTQLRQLLDSLNDVASATNCTVGFASDGQVDTEAASIIESGRTMMISELFG